MSKLSRSQAEQRQTQLNASRQCPPFGDACPAHARGRRVTQELHDQRGFRGQTLPHDSLESVFPSPLPPLEDSRGDQRYLIEQLFNHRDVDGVGRVNSSGGAAIPRPLILGSPAPN
uniref:Uncharacterized protein n=1 Tax=Peronospora matthiolae TaxID=2874970 RepID=A0AAV1T7F9_9STRA